MVLIYISYRVCILIILKFFWWVKFVFYFLNSCFELFEKVGVLIWKLDRDDLIILK